MIAVAGTLFLSFFFTRVVLLTMTGLSLVPGSSWPRIFIRGFWFDAMTLAYCISPFLLVRALCPDAWIRSVIGKAARLLSLWLVVFLLIFIGVAEVIFWQEFSTRFNFIAVDYLLYTQEVIGNIRQSYPMGWILSGMLIASLVISIAIHRYWVRHSMHVTTTMRARFAFLILAAAMSSVSYGVARVEQMEGSGNSYVDELSGNGLFSFSAALRRNELDYDRFYRTMPQSRADEILKSLRVPRYHAAVSRTSDEQLAAMGVLKRPKNVVLVSVESLSASFVGSYGAQWGITPNLDRLTKESLKFERFFATGTRTVRGLEALSLGTPPVPGQAIVRRPNNDHLSTVGQILSRQGFISSFLYGGYGYFDNMNAYFAGNDYQVVDRTDFPKESIPFENVWGVADESLFSNSLAAFDQAHAQGKRFFGHIMTTSNHRPFTYPQGRIDIPSPGDRPGAVKYTDYAIGRFIDEAKSHAWFKDTLFILTADHCASVAGKSKLPVEHYHIPLLFYAPALIRPGVVSARVSQIDLPPTVLDLMGAEGEKSFFGRSFFTPNQSDERAFISNYQELGYYKNDLLTVLLPRQRVEAYRIDPKTLDATQAPVDPQAVDEAVAFYQTAAREFKNGALSVDFKKHNRP